MNRWIVAFAALLLACKGEPAPSRAAADPSAAAAPSATASTSAAPVVSAAASASATETSSAPPAASAATAPARVACGSITCSPHQYCLHYDSGAGGADLPNKSHGDATTCSDTIPHNPGGLMCRPPNAARQAQCIAIIPRAPPHGGNSPD